MQRMLSLIVFHTHWTRRNADSRIDSRWIFLLNPVTQEDLDFYVTQFETSGFRGGVNYYRNFERNWEITEHLAAAKIEVPALFIAGEKDMVNGGATAAMLKGAMDPVMTDLRGIVIVPEMGHWIQQEDPAATNEALLSFLEAL